MKNRFRILVVFAVLMVSLLITTSVFAQTSQPGSGITYQGDKLVMADTFRLESGDSLEGNLVAIGSTVTISANAKVDGDIVLIGGTLTSDGTVNGNIVVIGGAITLGDTAVVNGDIVVTGATLKRSPLATVTGKITEQSPTIMDFKNSNPFLLPFKTGNAYLTRFLTVCLESLGLAVLAVIVGLLLPNQTKRVSDTIAKEPLVTGGVGLLTVICAPLALVLISLPLITIPITVLAVILLALAILYGWIAVGNEIGLRIGQLFHVEWATPVASGIGVLLITLVVGTSNLLPCLGWILGFIIIILGLGAVISSRFGSAKYANKLTQAVLPRTVVPITPAEPAAPVEPTPPPTPVKTPKTEK